MPWRSQLTAARAFSAPNLTAVRAVWCRLAASSRTVGAIDWSCTTSAVIGRPIGQPVQERHGLQERGLQAVSAEWLVYACYGSDHNLVCRLRIGSVLGAWVGHSPFRRSRRLCPPPWSAPEACRRRTRSWGARVPDDAPSFSYAVWARLCPIARVRVRYRWKSPQWQRIVLFLGRGER